MSLKIKGEDDIFKTINNLINQVRKLPDGKTVTEQELLSDDFIKKNTSFNSFNEFKLAAGSSMSDKFIQNNTSYKNLDEMIEAAEDYYISNLITFKSPLRLTLKVISSLIFFPGFRGSGSL